MRPDEKWSIGSMMDLRINDSVELYAEIMATDYNTKAQIAESGTFFAEEYATFHIDNPSCSMTHNVRQSN